MRLSHAQQVLVAQLVKVQQQPALCFDIVSTNTKTQAIGKLFQDKKLIQIGDDSVELLPEFFVQAHFNGITDESGMLTDDSEELAQEQIEENYRLFRAMLSGVS